MRILLLCHSFNSLSQRLFTALRDDGHELSVELDIADNVTDEAIELFRPDVLIAPFLKRRIAEATWRRLPCLIVHPGPPGDRGPSALDWAVMHERAHWGVTVLQATAEFDAGPVLAHAGFVMRPGTKASLYRREVTRAAVGAVREALQRLHLPPVAAPAGHDGWQPLMRQADRAIDWRRNDSEAIFRHLRAADGFPGVAATLFGQPAHLFDAHPANAATRARASGLGQPGDVIARRGPGVLVRTVDGAIWIGHVRRAASAADGLTLKLAATRAFAAESADLPEWPAALERPADGPDADWDELRYEEFGPADGTGARVGWLEFNFHNGAMSTRQCERLRDTLRELRQHPTKVLLLAGGADFFSNGIHLHDIEAAAPEMGVTSGDSAADASWRNINAMDDAALELLTMTDRLTLSVLRGNAGAGGCFLALAADQVWAHAGVVQNPHYKNMGNLYGSEYWTYTLPRRVGAAQAKSIMQGRLPIGAAEAQRIGLLDVVLGEDAAELEALARQQALELAASPDLAERIAAKAEQRAADEAAKPLQRHRDEELLRMHRNFYGFDPSYHVARHYFVHRKPHAWTPRHLAVHR
jgi:putative two-component system hydrogenase maturation factor HypX/HoxX